MADHRSGLFRTGSRWCSREELRRLESETKLNDTKDSRAELRRARARCGMPMVDSIIVRGRRWQDSFGNTYHTAEAVVDGKDYVVVPITYGYSDQYVWSAAEALVEAGFLPKGVGLDPQPYSEGRPGNPGNQPLWVYCRKNNIRLDYSAENVKRKKDLHLGGKKA